MFTLNLCVGTEMPSVQVEKILSEKIPSEVGVRLDAKDRPSQQGAMRRTPFTHEDSAD